MTSQGPVTGVPGEAPGPALVEKVKLLLQQDAAGSLAQHMAGFVSRQVAYGFRQPGKFPRPPEVDVGALMDLGS